MASKTKSVVLEIIQFVPILTLASSFIVTGEIDLERAGILFIISAGIALLVSAVVIVSKSKLNPVLIGTNLWLLTGAAAFGASIGPLADLVSDFRAAGLFTCIFIAGVVLSFGSGNGFSGIESTERSTVNKASIILLAISAMALAWSLLWIENIRLGGGLPFILLNVSRRILLRRLS